MTKCVASFQEGIWGGVQDKDGERVLVTARVLPGYLTCARDGHLPGCLFQFDDIDIQCNSGRKGIPAHLTHPLFCMSEHSLVII